MDRMGEDSIIPVEEEDDEECEDGGSAELGDGADLVQGKGLAQMEPGEADGTHDASRHDEGGPGRICLVYLRERCSRIGEQQQEEEDDWAKGRASQGG